MQSSVWILLSPGRLPIDGVSVVSASVPSNQDEGVVCGDVIPLFGKVLQGLDEFRNKQMCKISLVLGRRFSGVFGT